MKLNIGSGTVRGSRFEQGTGWFNVDFSQDPSKEEWGGAEYLKFDLTGTWPIPGDTVDCIFASHILEHVEYSKQRKLAEEAYRVLKPSAPMRIICPDPRIFIENWRAKNWNFVKDCYGDENWQRNGYEGNPAKAFTDMFFSDSYDHVLATSIDMIAVMLVRAGFSKVTEMRYTNTEFPQFFGPYDATGDNRPVMSWYLEAVK